MDGESFELSQKSLVKRLTTSAVTHRIGKARTSFGSHPLELLPPRSTAGQLTLDQHIGVRIPGGQPILMLVFSTTRFQACVCVRLMSDWYGPRIVERPMRDVGLGISTTMQTGGISVSAGGWLHSDHGPIHRQILALHSTLLPDSAAPVGPKSLPIG